MTTIDMMKTSRSVVMALVTITMAVTSCSNNSYSWNDQNGGNGEDLVECTLYAGFDGTKVSMGSDGATPNWESGDEILVLDADKKPVGTDGLFTLSSGAGTVSGNFTGKTNPYQIPRYAIYPASAATVSGTSAVTTGTLSMSAGDDAGSIKSAVMLGLSHNGADFIFTNACAVLTFNTGDYGKTDGDPAIKSVKVSASYGDTATPIAGAFTIDWTATPPSIAPAGSGTVNELTVELPSALQANDKNVYIPIFPLPMQSSTAPSMTFEFTNTSDFLAEISYDFSAAIAANTMKNLGTAQGMEFKEPYPEANEIWYTTSDGQPITIYNGYQPIEYFGVNLESNIISGGKGVLKFDGDIQKINGINHYSPFYGNKNLTSIYLPPTSAELKDECFAMDFGCTIYFPDTYTSKNVNGYIFWYASGHARSKFYLVTSKGTTEYISDGGPGVIIEFADGSKVYLNNGSCFAKGTLITLADGSRKAIEELEFSDKLKVWNFDEGHEDVADILWISPGERFRPYYYKCTFSDGTTLDVVGEEGGSCHRIFDRTKGSFVRGHSIDIGDEVYTENGLVTLVSCEKIDNKVEFFNVVTEKHINCFTNGVLTSARYNNRYPISKNMKFIKDGRKIRPYREFRKAGISRQWYDGMRLGEVQDSIAVVKKYIVRSESLGDLNPEWKEPGFFARIWNWIKSLFA